MEISDPYQWSPGDVAILTTVARWRTVIATSKGELSQVAAYASKSRGCPKTLLMKNGLPYLSQDLFWEAMEDIARQTTLVSGHPWPEQSYPMIHAVQEVVPTPAPPFQVSSPGKSVSFNPHQARNELMRLFDEKPKPNANRSRLSGVAKTLIFGAQTGRGSEDGVVIKKTYEQKYTKLIQVVHQLAQSVVDNDNALPSLGFQILKLERGQDLNQHWIIVITP